MVLGTCLEKNLTSTYARCKLELHQQLLTHPELQLTWARVFYPYGLGEPADKFCSSTIAKFRRGESLHLQNPKAQRDYIQVDDLAAALCTLVTSDFTGSVDLGTGQGVTMQDLSATLAAMLNRPDLIQIPDQPPAGDSLIANPAPLHQLGWKPQISLEDGLRQMVLS
jgi:nucleoside-diphosphate-sugar epimerase